MKRSWFVAQIGAREHYAVARALQARGELERLYTEFWAREGALLNRAPGPLRALANRRDAGVPDGSVTAFNAATLGAAAQAMARAKLGNGEATTEANYREFIRVGRDFARRCVRDLARRGVDGENHAFFGYNTGSLETLRWLQGRGVPTIVGQIDPGRVEEDLVHQESEKWPGWAALPGRIPDAYYDRLRAEWAAATKVLVNSPWSRDALVKQGVMPTKIVIVPLAYEAPELSEPAPAREENAPLRVLWLGSVTLRKGIPYLLEAALLLKKTGIRFTIAGPLGIDEAKAASAPANVEWAGRVERDAAAALYRQADVFVLPTISDGFAITQLEAMAHGLPVITTAHCGQVVTPGVDGEIVPVANAEALAAALLALDRDREKLRAMQGAARQKARQFSLARFADGLDAALAD